MFVAVHRVDKGPREGERLPLICRSDGSLDPYVVAWSMQARTRLTPSSRETALYEILAAKLWAKIAGVDIEQVMIYGPCLSSEQVSDLFYHLHLRSDDLRMLATAKPLHATKLYEGFARISASSLRRRTTFVHDYLAWLGAYGNRVLRRTGRDDAALMDLRGERLRAPIAVGKGRPQYHANSIAAELLGNRPAVRPSRLSTVPTAQLEEFGLAVSLMDRALIWPKNGRRALRNELILKTLIETGLRSGEMRQIKISDIRPRERKIAIVRRHNDPDSKGRRESNAKTHDGLVSLAPETWSLLTDWLAIHADITANAREASDFLFINLDRNPAHSGQQMSGPALDAIVKQAARHFGLPALSAHPLRHLKARRLAELVREKKLTPEEARKAITYLMRWSDGSVMLDHYLGDSADLQAEAVMETIHRERGQHG